MVNRESEKGGIRTCLSRTPEERNQTPLYNAAAPLNDSRPVPATTDLQGKTSCLA